MVHLWFFSPCSKQLECFSGTGAWSWLTRLTIAWALYFGRCGLTNWSSWSIFSSLLHVIQVWSQPFPVGRCQCSHRMKLAQSRWSGPGGRKKLRAPDQLEERKVLKKWPMVLKCSEDCSMLSPIDPPSMPCGAGSQSRTIPYFLSRRNQGDPRVAFCPIIFWDDAPACFRMYQSHVQRPIKDIFRKNTKEV